MISENHSNEALLRVESDSDEDGLTKSEYCWVKPSWCFQPTEYTASSYLSDNLQDICVKEFSMIPPDYFFREDGEMWEEASCESPQAKTARSDSFYSSIGSCTGSNYTLDSTLDSSVGFETALDISWEENESLKTALSFTSLQSLVDNMNENYQLNTCESTVTSFVDSTDEEDEMNTAREETNLIYDELTVSTPSLKEDQEEEL